jgi:hypothetical protein
LIRILLMVSSVKDYCGLLQCSRDAKK